MKITFTIIAIVIIVGGGIWYFASNGSYGNTNTAGVTNTTTNSNKNNSPVNENVNAGAVDYTITLTEYAFSPKTITAAPGATIKVKVTNAGQTAHDFVIDELNVRTALLSAGESQIVSITAPTTTTTYDFYCNVSNHRSLGMEGTLTVQTQ